MSNNELIEQARATINHYHARQAHPSYEYAFGSKPEGDGWEINGALLTTVADQTYWRRRKVQVALVQP